MSTPPVLLLIFNRPDHLLQVMDALRLARPKKLYVAADGPRERSGEFEACQQAREVATRVDWDCDVQTLFRDRNLGCRVAVSTAIDWFFEHEEQGIILEDDCVPSQSFFPYCAELLEKYRDDTRIMCVSGDNFQKGNQVTSYSYYFSKYMHCWGWATWRRAWKLYDRDMTLWPEFMAGNGLRSISDGSLEFEEAWSRTLETAYLNKIDSWAYRYLFSCWANNGLTCLPAKNLVSNVGFDTHGTHTTNAESAQANMPAYEISFPLSHPATLFRNVDADRFEDLHVFGIRKRKKTFSARVKRKAKTVRETFSRRLGIGATA